MLATTKSARASSDRELINWAILDSARNEGNPLEAYGKISAIVAHERGDVRADVILRVAEADGAAPTVTKAFRLNGVPRRALEFVGEINVVSFAPDDVALVDGPPSGRRRYLDVMNAQISSRYLRTLQRYGKVLIQRNALLRRVRENGRPDSSLSVWDEELASNGALLLQERARAVAALGARADSWFRDLGGWGQHLQITYRPGIADGQAEPLHNLPAQGDDALGRIHAAFCRALEDAAPRERILGMSLVGPHRDDLAFVVDGVDLNTFGSRGQQRLAALSLKLAELDLMSGATGARPILLLDDVLSELDQQKQASVLRVAAASGQTLLTVTSFDAVRDALPNASALHLEAGAIEPLRRAR